MEQLDKQAGGRKGGRTEGVLDERRFIARSGQAVTPRLGFRSVAAAARRGARGEAGLGGGFWRETSAGAPKTQKIPGSHGRAGRHPATLITMPPKQGPAPLPLLLPGSLF